MSDAMYDYPTNKQLLERIRNTWNTYGKIENTDLTSSQLNAVEDFLRDIEALFEDR